MVLECTDTAPPQEGRKGSLWFLHKSKSLLPQLDASRLNKNFRIKLFGQNIMRLKQTMRKGREEMDEEEHRQERWGVLILISLHHTHMLWAAIILILMLTPQTGSLSPPDTFLLTITTQHTSLHRLLVTVYLYLSSTSPHLTCNCTLKLHLYITAGLHPLLLLSYLFMM